MAFPLSQIGLDGDLCVRHSVWGCVYEIYDKRITETLLQAFPTAK